MISKWLFSGAFLFEIGSWAALFNQVPDSQSTLLFVVAHTFSSVMLTAGVWLLLPKRYKYPLPWSAVFVFSIAFFIPMLGAIGVAAAVFPALYMPRKQHEQVWNSMGIPDLPFQPQEKNHSLMFHDGGLQDVLRHAPSAEMRATALFATRRMVSKDAVPILKLALRDPVDDVRLLAYSMLDQKESRINQRIEIALHRLSTAMDAERPALHTTLARWYWELAYLGLAQGSVLDHVLEQARSHADTALELGAGDGTFILAGRIAMELGSLDRALAHFNSAQAAGIDEEKLIPYRAEIAFLQGRYEAIAEQLNQLSADTLQRPPFAALARYWL